MKPDYEQQAADEERHRERSAHVQYVVVAWGSLGYYGTLREAEEAARKDRGVAFARVDPPPEASEQAMWAKDHEYRVWVYEDGTAALDKPDGREYLDTDQTRYIVSAIAFAPCINTKAEKVVVKP